MILIAGPCVIEHYEYLQETMEYIIPVIKNKNIDFYFKGSCIKDNRTTIDNFQGIGFEKGINYLQRIRDKFNVKITTDFHSIKQLLEYGSSVDLIQIPAYLAQQTSLLQSASSIGKPIHIKKPQFLGPIEFNKVIQKLRDLNFKEQIIGTDRGTILGYNQTFVDPRHIGIIQADKVLSDITHPNKNYPGNVQYEIEQLGMASIAAGSDGVFLETVVNCKTALCDSNTMLLPNKFDRLINKLYDLWRFINE